MPARLMGLSIKEGRQAPLGMRVVSVFTRAKIWGLWEAGAVVTRHIELDRKIRMRVDHGQSKKYAHDLIAGMLEWMDYRAPS